jgi:glutamate transport system substrate-binding protein
VALLSPLLGNLLTSESDAGSSGDSPGSDSSLFDDDTVQVGMRVDRLETGHYRPPEGGFSAFSVDVVLALLKEARVTSEPIYVNVPWDRQISELTKRAVGLDAALTITPSRMREVDFVGPFASSAQGFLVRARGTKSIQKFGDLNGKRVCVGEGSLSADALKENEFKEIAVDIQPDFSSCVDRLRNGAVDALAADSLALSALEVEHNDLLRVVPDISFGAPNAYGIALPKGYSKDCKHLRDAMVKYVSSDTWLRNFEKRLPTAYRRGMDEARPKESEIKAQSCRNTPAHG